MCCISFCFLHWLFSRSLLLSNSITVQWVVPSRCWVIPAKSHIPVQKFMKVNANVWCFFAASLLIICKSLQIAFLSARLYYQSATCHYYKIPDTINLLSYREVLFWPPALEVSVHEWLCHIVQPVMRQNSIKGEQSPAKTLLSWTKEEMHRMSGDIQSPLRLDKYVLMTSY